MAFAYVLGATGIDRYIERHIVMYAIELRHIDEFRWYRRKKQPVLLLGQVFLFKKERKDKHGKNTLQNLFIRKRDSQAVV